MGIKYQLLLYQKSNKGERRWESASSVYKFSSFINTLEKIKHTNISLKITSKENEVLAKKVLDLKKF